MESNNVNNAPNQTRMLEKGVSVFQAWQQMLEPPFPKQIVSVLCANLLEQMTQSECLRQAYTLQNWLPAKSIKFVIFLLKLKQETKFQHGCSKEKRIALTPQPISSAVLRMPPFVGMYCPSFSIYCTAPSGNMVPPPGKMKCGPSCFIHPWCPFLSAILLWGMLLCHICIVHVNRQYLKNDHKHLMRTRYYTRYHFMFERNKKPVKIISNT